MKNGILSSALIYDFVPVEGIPTGKKQLRNGFVPLSIYIVGVVKSLLIPFIVILVNSVNLASMARTVASPRFFAISLSWQNFRKISFERIYRDFLKNLQRNVRICRLY